MSPSSLAALPLTPATAFALANYAQAHAVYTQEMSVLNQKSSALSTAQANLAAAKSQAATLVAGAQGSTDEAQADFDAAQKIVTAQANEVNQLWQAFMSAVQSPNDPPPGGAELIQPTGNA